ncbi:hypothetical protein [Vibrio gelatinilyticus]|nr:hypothetical protein [Vibrio gelatinilyticus]
MQTITALVVAQWHCEAALMTTWFALKKIALTLLATEGRVTGIHN